MNKQLCRKLQPNSSGRKGIEFLSGLVHNYKHQMGDLRNFWPCIHHSKNRVQQPENFKKDTPTAINSGFLYDCTDLGVLNLKKDITNVNGDLSRKIKAFVLALFLANFAPGQPGLAIANPLETPVSINVEQLRTFPSEKIVIIDTRSRWKYFVSHIRGSVNLADWQDFTEQRAGVKGLLIEDKGLIVSKLRPLGIDRNKTIVLYGDPTDRWRTDGRFLWMFERFGFESVRILTGGLELWEESGGEIERGKQKSVSPSELSPEDIRFDDNVMATGSWIHKNLDRLAVIDNRTEKEYNGATPYGSPRGGHIPQAIHIPWEQFFTESGVLKSKPELNALLKKNGIDSDKEVVVYCTGGVRSGMAYYAFRSLGVSVRNYDGSWWDWSLDSKLPVEGNS